jgi:hypothetical protein
MKSVGMASVAIVFSAAALAQTTIYKHVDETGRVTYSNRPIKGATVVELEPVNLMPTPPAVLAKVAGAAEKPAGAADRSSGIADKPAAPLQKASLSADKPRPPVAIVTPLVGPSLASIDMQVQRKRDGERRRILEEELDREERTLATVRESMVQERQNPALVAAVRAAQEMADPTPSQLVEVRGNLDKVSGRIRGLQATAAEHEKNIEALRKELGALKP